MDRNSATGLVLMFALIFVYFQFFAPNPAETPKKAKTEVKSKTQAKTSKSEEKANVQQDSLTIAQNAKLFGGFAKHTVGVEKNFTLSNKNVAITFSNKGASISQVILPEYKTYDGKPLYLWEKDRSASDILLPTKTGLLNTSSLYFSGSQNDSSVVFEANGLLITYILPKEGYQLKQKISQTGSNDLSPNGTVSFIIKDDLPVTEKDLANSRVNATVNYYTKDGLENLKESSTDEKKADFAGEIKWVSLKSRFFNVGLIPQNPFTKGSFRSATNPNDSLSIKVLEASCSLDASSLQKDGISLQWYLGPNKFKVLQGVTDGYDQNVYLGIPVVNLLNRYLVVNVFYWLENSIGNYGIIIILLVVLIRLILFPLNYRSYIGMAKMRVLQPELTEAKERCGDDTAAFQQEQMKIYQQAGVNPLSGCVPLLLQLPVLLAMFNFFPNAIELRQKSLWWSTDLSTFDSIAQLPFSLPGYGNHVSLFTILMTLSTLLLTWYNNKNNTAMANNQMAVMGYIMPVFFMFILNSLPAGLNFYYLVSNIASLTQQIIIRSTVNDSAIHALVQANKVKIAQNPKKQSGFQARLAEAMKAAEEQKKQRPPQRKPKK